MRLLITGASGQLGGYLLRHLAGSDISVTAWSGTRSGKLFGFDLEHVDLANPGNLERSYRAAGPDLIIHAGAVTRIADAYRNPAQAQAVNVAGTSTLAQLAEQAGARFIYVSTDLVFDGEKGGYAEEDLVAPLSAYGRTKAEAETAVLSGQGTVVRVSLLFGPTVVGRASFFDDQVNALRAGRPMTLFEDEWRTPLSLTVAARALVAIAQSEFRGLMHLGGPERLSRLEMGLGLAESLGCRPDSIVPSKRADAPAPEPRPRDTSLDSSRWRLLFPQEDWPSFAGALREMLSRNDR